MLAGSAEIPDGVRFLQASQTTKLRQGRAARPVELLNTALHLANDLIATPRTPAAELGKRGGLKTAERRPDYYRQIAVKRKTRAGGRPKKQSVWSPTSASIRST